jgi:hypothetical protein
MSRLPLRRQAPGGHLRRDGASPKWVQCSSGEKESLTSVKASCTCTFRWIQAEQELRPLPTPARSGLCHLFADALVSKSVSIRPMTLVLYELETGPLHRFRDWPNEQIPKRAAGVYTVWDPDRLLYVGMSGRAMTALAAALGTSSVCMSVTASSSQPSPPPSKTSSPPAGCRWTTSPEASSANGSLTGSSSPPIGPRLPGWRRRFDEGRRR